MSLDITLTFPLLRKCLEQFICGKYDECAKTAEVGLEKFKDDFFLKLMKATLMKVKKETSTFILYYK